MSIPTSDNTDSMVRFTSGKYLTLKLAQESYGIEVTMIREIIRMPKVTPVPQMPDYVRGVINLRGKVVPLIDLSLKFGLQAIEAGERNCVIVVDIEDKNGIGSLVGLIVDAVEEVISIPEDCLEPSPNFGGSLSNESCLGIAKIKNSVMTLLDIEKVVNREMSGDLATL